jgi:hypothetical protein
VFVCNSPIDRNAIARSDALTGARIQPYYLILREAAKAAALRQTVVKGDCPYVGLTEHPAADGTTVVMAVNFEPRAVTCPITVRGRLGRVWRGRVSDEAVTLPPNEAALFEVTP